MKRLFALTLTLCLLASALGITAFAAPAEDAPPAGVVLRIRGEDSSGQIVAYENGDYTDHAKGWEAAIDLALSGDEMKKNDFRRVVVDIYADWTAKADGEFCNSGDGFNWDAIYFPANVRVTLNMNGHTIDRDIRDDYQYNGEVMCVGDDADVIINDGTITGGWSCNGAGGIHINDGANVTLNNVHVDRNIVEDDDGAAIAVYHGATLTMNGGSLSENVVYASYSGTASSTTGTLYVDDAEAYLKEVTIEKNVNKKYRSEGVGVTVVSGGYVSLTDCKILNNGYFFDHEKGPDYVDAASIIYVRDKSSIDIVGGEFKDNGCTESYANGGYIINIREGTMTMTDVTTFTGNLCKYLLKISDYHNGRYSDVYVSGCTFEDNPSYGAFTGCGKENMDSYFDSCVFNNNKVEGVDDPTFYFDTTIDKCSLSFLNCDFGDSTFSDESYARMAESQTEETVGSMMGEGSLPMVVAMAALVVSVAALGVAMTSKKKKDSDN